jgi:hypothetical protein
MVFPQGCLPEGITFTTQDQIDNFQTNYPGCTEIEGYVIIEGDDISNLDSLCVLTSIEGTLVISNNSLTSLTPLQNLTSLWGLSLYQSSLTNLAGLENITSFAGNLQLSENNVLSSLSGLENLASIGGFVWIKQNIVLENLTGLNNLVSVEGNFDISLNNNLTSLIGLGNLQSITGSLRIGPYYEGNPALINLTGLEALTNIGGYLNVINNPHLTDLNALENLTSIGGQINIALNPELKSLSGLDNIQANTIGNIYVAMNNNLSVCDVQSVCDFMTNPNPMIIFTENTLGCNSVEEVEQHCLTSTKDNLTIERLSFFPNPATSFITIQIQEGIPVEEVIIYNHIGQKALEAVPVNNTVDVSKLKPGIYFLEVITTESQAETKLVIE